MTSNYPTSADSFTNPSPGDVVTSAPIGNSFDSIEAIQGFVGLTGSPAGAGTLVGRIKTLEAAGGATFGFPPSGYNLTDWSFDPAVGSSSSGIAAGVLYVTRLYLQAQTVTRVHNILFTNGSGLTNGWMALYNGAGALLSQGNANMAATWANAGSVGLTTSTLTTPQVVTKDFYYVGWWVAAISSSSPQFLRGLSANYLVTLGPTATTHRCATANSGLAATAPATLSAMSANNFVFWAGVS